MMKWGAEDEVAEDAKKHHLPIKSKQKTFFVKVTASKPTNPKDKSITTRINTHSHKYPRVIVEASIILSGVTPVQEFIVNLQELLKNRQLVDKIFTFCLINLEGADKKIYETSDIPSNMTMLDTHFKMLSNGKNPFEKQKQWGKAKKDKEEFHNPIVYFSLAMATDKKPKDLLSRIIHEWQSHGAISFKC
jgi:hypothetical protein